MKKTLLEQPNANFDPPPLITTSGVAVGVALVTPILVGLSLSYRESTVSNVGCVFSCCRDSFAATAVAAIKGEIIKRLQI